MLALSRVWRNRARTAMNVVHMRVKPGQEQAFLRVYEEFHVLGGLISHASMHHIDPVMGLL
jgi:hypothetical protein